MRGKLLLGLASLVCLIYSVRGDEADLYKFLFETHHYNKHIRPKYDHANPIELKIEMELIKIIGLSEIDEVLDVVGMFVLKWTDDHMKWVPSNFGNIVSMVIDPTEIWLPDIGLENSADTFYHSTFTDDFRPRIYYTGEVQWSFGGQISTTCGLDMTYFPFDKQTCLIQIENWAYHGDEVRLRNGSNHVHLDAYEKHGIWDVIETESSWQNNYFEATGPDPFPEVDFKIFMVRKTQFYLLNLILPCILLIGVALGNFWLPVESGEKASLGVTLLLAFSVLQIVLSDQTPKNSDYSPVLAQMVIWIMTLSAISVIISIFILYLYHKDSSQRVPYCMRRFFFCYLSRFLCMHSSVPEVGDKKGQATTKEEDPKVQDLENPSGGNEKSKLATALSGAGGGGELASIASNLEYIAQTIRDKEDSEVIQEEWRSVARIVDRTLFWICLIIVLCVLCVFLTKQDNSH